MQLARKVCRRCDKSFRPTAPKFVRCEPCRKADRPKRGKQSETSPTFFEPQQTDPERRQYAPPITDAARRAIKLARTAHKQWRQFKSADEVQRHINALAWFAECAQSGFIPSTEWQLQNVGFIVAR